MTHRSRLSNNPPTPFRALLLLSVALLPTAWGQTTAQDLSVSPQTSLIVSSTNDPLRVPGSDGLVHLEYDLMLTNALSLPATVTSAEVFDAGSGDLLLRLEGAALAATAWPAPTGEAIDPVPALGLAALMIDVAVPPDSVPERLTHKISYTLPAGTPGPALVARTVNGLELAVDPREPVVIAPPLRGTNWFNANGCCVPSAPHRESRWVVDGVRYVKPEMFAVDWLRLGDGRLFRGDGSRVEQYFGYGAEVVSVADGTVVYVKGDMPDTPPLTTPTTLKTLRDYAGNNVVVEIEPGVFVTYAHLQPGSPTVEVGDRVETGQLLGLLGSSGNSTGPHLHFQLSDGPDLTASNSLPFVFDRYRHLGDVDPASVSEATFTRADAPPLKVVGPARTEEGNLPVNFALQAFR